MKDKDLINGVIEFLIGSQDEIRKTLRRWQASLNDGLGVYLAAMGLLGFSMFFAYGAWQQAQPDRRAMDAFGKLLEVPQEPMRMEERPTLAGALVMSLANWNICQLPNRTTEVIIDEIYRLFLARYLGNTVDVTSFKHLGDTEAGLTTLRLDPPSSRGVVLQKAVQLAETKGIGSALEVPRQRSTIRVPSVTVAVMKGVPKHFEPRKFLSVESLYPLVGFSPHPGTRISTNTADSLWDATEKNKLHEFANPDFKAFYFIALDGSVAVTPPLNRPIAASRSYSHASYVSAVLERKSSTCPGATYRYHSRPYIDIADNGLVATLCYPVESPCRDCSENGTGTEQTIAKHLSRSTPAKAGAGSVLEGVFCIDIGLPRRAIFESLSQLALLDTFPVRVTEIGGASNINPCGDDTYPCPDPYKPQSKQGRDRVEAVVREWLKRQPRESVAGSGELGPVEIEGRVYYVAALWRDGRTGTTRELAVLALPDRSLGWYFAMQIVGLALCAIIAASLIGWSRRGQEARRQVALVRGLPMGVMRLDERGGIVGANDRAEEILRRRLPPLLLGESPLNRITSDLDNFSQVLVEPPLVGIWRDDHYEWSHYSQIDAQRAKGLASEYYVKIIIGDNEKKQWIRVLGSPIVSVDQQIHTFGLFEPVTTWRAQELEKSLNAHLHNPYRSAK
ncbi:hypothetical protein ACLESO_01195 [Pyxidicoccus sp. 3LG]